MKAQATGQHMPGKRLGRITRSRAKREFPKRASKARRGTKATAYLDEPVFPLSEDIGSITLARDVSSVLTLCMQNVYTAWSEVIFLLGIVYEAYKFQC